MDSRWVVTVSRSSAIEDTAELVTELVTIGPFRLRGRAEARARVVRRLADRYAAEDDATLDVSVEPLLPSRTSAQDALGVLYGSIEVEGGSDVR